MFDLIFPLLLIILGVIYRINPPKIKKVALVIERKPL